MAFDPVAGPARLALLLACALAGCRPEADRAVVDVYAAASTRDALLALEAGYERAHQVELVFNFGSSGDLARQIVAAARADVFLSADERELDRVAGAGLVAPGTRQDLLSNRLAVVEPASAPSPFQSPFEPGQLGDPRIRRVSLANVESVPAGRYARQWLEQRGAWPLVEAKVLPGVDARAALAAVESGGAECGIVYASDAAGSRDARVVHRVPAEEGPRIVYPVAALVRGRAAGEARDEARAFVAHLRSQEARAAFEACGFLVLPGP